MKNEKSLYLLHELLDGDTYRQVTELLAGQTVYFPLVGSTKEKQQRNREIRSDYYDGMEYPELMKKYDLGERQLRKIISRT